MNGEEVLLRGADLADGTPETTRTVVAPLDFCQLRFCDGHVVLPVSKAPVLWQLRYVVGVEGLVADGARQPRGHA